MNDDIDYESFLDFLPSMPRGPPPTPEELQRTPELAMPSEVMAGGGGGERLKKDMEAFLKARAEGKHKEVAVLRDSLIAEITRLSRR